MNTSLPQITELRNNIDFASITQFFHTFQSAFRPWPASVQDVLYARQLHTTAHLNSQKEEYVFETEDLERMILDAAERVRFEDLLIRMLRVLTRNRFINVQNWQSYFSREFDKREFDQINPFLPPPTEGAQNAEDKAVKAETLEKAQDEQSKTEEPKEEPDDGLTVDTPQHNSIGNKKPELINFFTLPMDTRVHLLYILCEWQLDDPERFREHLESEDDAVQWRVEPIGFDRKGSTFWLFDDNRLYKETVKPKKKSAPKKAAASRKRKRLTPVRRSSRRNAPAEEAAAEEESEDESEWMPWKLICSTKLEWEQLPAKYEHSKNVDEQRFYQLLVNDLLPKVLPVIEEHEKELKKQEAILNRKRSSRIMIKELEALERAASAELEDEAVLATTNADGHRRSGRTSNRLEQKTKEKEQHEKEMLAKAREQRLLERERRIQEREYRALQREKRQQQEEDEEGADRQEGQSAVGGTTIDEQQQQHQQSQAQPATAVENDTGGKMPKKKGRKPKEPANGKEQKPKRKYVRKLDENGNPIPRKPRLDENGNPIPPKKRGRKPKNRNPDEENWMFACICGVSGQNLDDGEPMIACEKCGVWQHIKCLQNSGLVEKSKSLDNISFICSGCEKKEQEIEVDIDDEQPSYNYKRQRTDHYEATTTTAGYYRSQFSQQQQHTVSASPMQTSWYPQPQQHISSSSVREYPSTPMNQVPGSQHQGPYYPSSSNVPSIKSAQQQSIGYSNGNGNSAASTNNYNSNSTAAPSQQSYMYQSYQQHQQQQTSPVASRQFIPYQFPSSPSQQPSAAHYIHASHIAQRTNVGSTAQPPMNNAPYHSILPHPQRPIRPHPTATSPSLAAAPPAMSSPQKPLPSLSPQQNQAAVVASFTSGTMSSSSTSTPPAPGSNGSNTNPSSSFEQH